MEIAMKLASQIMNPNVISIRKGDSLGDAIKILTGKKISGLPVVDENNKVVGVLSDRDLIDYSEKLMTVPLFDYTGWLLQYNEIPQNVISKNAEKFSGTKVEEVMSHKVVIVREDAEWFEVINLIRKHSINRIPVVDAEGRLKGIITRSDIINNLMSGDE
jgi:CBS domain-containing protein